MRRLDALIALLRGFLALLLVLSTPVLAQGGGVVSAADARAAEAGREMLRAGGNATDAALAMLVALTVVEPQSSGIGGGGFLVHHDAATGTIATIDGRETAPAAAIPERFLGPDGKPLPFLDAVVGGHSVGVPGNVALMAEAHRRWGKLPWKRLFDPAIRLAEQGYTVGPILERSISSTSRLWTDLPEIRALYEGKTVGTTIRNPALGRLLRRIANHGPKAFYTGKTARAISKAVATAPRNPSALTLADLANYRAIERPAQCGRYRQWKICSMGPPSSGATTVLGILGMLQRFDMKALGSRDPRAWHLIGEAMQLAYADRDLYLGDADFVSVPVAGLLAPNYLAERSALISPDRALSSYVPGVPPGAPARTRPPEGKEQGTTHFVATDHAGNVVSMTSTVEGPFGSQLIAEGIVLNNELTDFAFVPTRDSAPAANRVEPGKRPLSSMSPTIVYDEAGKPVLALGSAGGKRIIMHVAKTLVGVLDWDLPPREAIALPNIFFRGSSLLVEKGTMLETMTDDLVRMGHQVSVAELGSKVNAVAWSPEGWKGAADPRSEGVALEE